MRNAPLKGFLKKSPMKTNTELVDRIYTKSKVNESLKKKGEHTEGELRGKKDTTPKNNLSASNNQMMNPGV